MKNQIASIQSISSCAFRLSYSHSLVDWGL
jgi:hypothetical protein